MNVEMPKSSSFQAGVLYEEHLDHLEQVTEAFPHGAPPIGGAFDACPPIGLQLDPLCVSLLRQMEDSEGTVRQIGAFSEEINNLTVTH